MRGKYRRKRVMQARARSAGAERPNQRWSMDFMSDRLADGRAFRVLTLVDQFSRECPLLEADRPWRGRASGGMSGIGWPGCRASPKASRWTMGASFAAGRWTPECTRME